MPSPATPDDLKSALPDPSTDECTAVSKALLEFPTKVWQIFTWMLTSAGEISAEFVKSLNLVKPGDLIFSASPLDQSGRLLCDGRTISRTTYADLFAKIGTLYGAGDGTTTFKIPDYRGRFPIMIGESGEYSLGGTGGAKEVTLGLTNLPSLGSTVTGVFVNKSSGGNFDITTEPSGTLHDTVSWGGVAAPVNNMPPFVGVFVYLKT